MKQHNIVIHLLLLLIILFVFTIVNGEECACQLEHANTVKIVDVQEISDILTRARDDFMAKRAIKSFDKLQAAILIPTNQTIVDDKKQVKKVWLRGHVDGTVTQYPASCVKMNYMLAAIHWCKSKGRPIDCLDDHVRPMIVYSDNVQTGFVVDAITETTNIQDLNSTLDSRWPAWIQKRRYTQNLLEKFNLLDNQIVLSKTYPTNSGDNKYGAEKVLIDTIGSNRMQPCCAASLMLHVQNELTDEEIRYVQGMLWHRRDDGYSSFGYSLPPGTTLWNKVGDAYDTVEDIARIILPNQQEFILAAFSNGLKRSTDFGVLSMFAERVIEYFGFMTKPTPQQPAFITLTTDMKNNFTMSGTWIRNDDSTKSDFAPDRIGTSLYYTTTPSPNTSTFSWNANIVSNGFYEVLIYVPTITSQSLTISVTVSHMYGVDTVNVSCEPSRWNKVGDFIFSSGYKNAVVTVTSSSRLNTVVNGVRFAQYPAA